MSAREAAVWTCHCQKASLYMRLRSIFGQCILMLVGSPKKYPINKKPSLSMRDDIVASLTARISSSTLNVLHGELPQRQVVGKHVEVG